MDEGSYDDEERDQLTVLIESIDFNSSRGNVERVRSIREVMYSLASFQFDKSYRRLKRIFDGGKRKVRQDSEDVCDYSLLLAQAQSVMSDFGLRSGNYLSLLETAKRARARRRGRRGGD